ncbi:DNA-binding transcriptional regulator, FadR family [Brevibacterium sandarakinum]|uniref:DNA-binding transcriptional regulator, FadR family n=1 Tax=Brevibacterium sandarakinum TaxID=629680 RepID=A0A1H1PKA4_BRESA|nr:GntR family transcriptional regulator [Brevibacterium sandarakinum]SDS11563.1 DNA-binding transcriptional regulator, FadR family [Brevibacterium sandarakinum]
MTGTSTMSQKTTTSDRIKDVILSDGLRPGDLLPTEGELCDRLGVSRSNVREAIRKLSTLDIVDVRHGHGTYVGEMSLDALVEALVFRGVLSPGDDLRALRDVVEVRAALDFGMAEAIVTSLAGTTNPKLSGLVDEMVAMAQDGKSFPQQDRAFHTGLLEALDNSLVGQLVAAFWDVHTAVLPRLNVAVAADLEQTARAHGQMLEAAQAGDVEAFHAAITVHYDPIARALDRDVN